jgi:ParB/RepB/Spo0J family partition protein
MYKMDANEIVSVLMLEIFADPTFNCRGAAIAPIDVIDLVKDIETHGLQQPIVIQPYDKYQPEKYKYRIVSGHRRHMAFKVMKRTHIPCIINTHLTESQALILNLGENLHRLNLNIMQEATALERLKMSGMSTTEVGRELGKSSAWVNIRYMLLELPEPIRNAAASGLINQQQIKEIHSLPDIKAQIEAAKKIKDAKVRGEKVPRIKPIGAVKRNILKTKIRDKDDLFWMQDHIQESVGNNFGTRCLAWAAGEISDFELFQDIREIAAEKNVDYKIPYGLANLG